ncbi:MAG: hypothetical protein IPI95_02985 [Flavobacteriales bacterium]|nr:hypothetical protein [Flavobacteriales bacterium]
MPFQINGVLSVKSLLPTTGWWSFGVVTAPVGVPRKALSEVAVVLPIRSV